MKFRAAMFAGWMLIAVACNIGTATVEPSGPSCGDGVCAGPENAVICPQDCREGAVPSQTVASGLTETDAEISPGQIAPGEKPDTYWMINPATGAKLFILVTRPRGGDSQVYPVMVCVPGGLGAQNLSRGSGRDEALLAQAGFLVVDFDADGRGQSGGEEDYNGFAHQDGLAALILAIGQIPGADPDNIGLLSRSYGVTMASGALGRYPGLPVRFYIDWEGPADRYSTTTDCHPREGGIDWPSCSDDAFWAEREALAYIGRVRVPYQRVQSEEDHVQPDNRHAVAMINAAVQGGAPWVRLNDYPEGDTYDLGNPPAMLPESVDSRITEVLIRYVQELFALPQ